MIMAAAALPKNATLEDVRVGLAGNICRCTGYTAIYRAVQRAQAPQKASGSRLRSPATAERATARQAQRPASGRSRVPKKPAAGRKRVAR